MTSTNDEKHECYFGNADGSCTYCGNLTQPRSAAIHGVVSAAAACRECDETELHKLGCFFNRSLGDTERTRVLDVDRRPATEPPAATEAAKCANHCEHEPSKMVGGVCVAWLPYAMDACGHRCTTTEASPPERIWIDKLTLRRGNGYFYYTQQEPIESVTEYILRFLHDAQVARLREALRGLPDLVPTSWLDSLLTGPDAVVGKPPYSGSDIETLLRAIKKRIADTAARVVLQEKEGMDASCS